jgi:hypothetical protein
MVLVIIEHHNSVDFKSPFRVPKPERAYCIEVKDLTGFQNL